MKCSEQTKCPECNSADIKVIIDKNENCDRDGNRGVSVTHIICNDCGYED